jgi:hypothetical protein
MEQEQPRRRSEVICLSNKPYISGGGFRTDGSLGNLTLGKTYCAVREEGMWRVWDDLGEDYLYPLEMFRESA